MTAAPAVHVLPGWADVVTRLQLAGFTSARTETASPGWWWVMIDGGLPDGRDHIQVASHRFDEGHTDEASIDPAGPGDYFLVYRQRQDPAGHWAWVTDDIRTSDASIHGLLFAIAHALLAPLQTQLWGDPTPEAP